MEHADSLAALATQLITGRLRQHLSQEQLAMAAGVGRRVVINAENGRSITTESLMRLLKALSLELYVGRRGPATVVARDLDANG